MLWSSLHGRSYLMAVPITAYSLGIGQEHVEFAEAKLQRRIIAQQLEDEQVNALAVMSVAGIAAEGMTYPEVSEKLVSGTVVCACQQITMVPLWWTLLFAIRNTTTNVQISWLVYVLRASISRHTLHICSCKLLQTLPNLLLFMLVCAGHGPDSRLVGPATHLAAQQDAHARQCTADYHTLGGVDCSRQAAAVQE